MAGIVKEHLFQRIRQADIGSVGGTAGVAGASRWAVAPALAMATGRTGSMTWAARAAVCADRSQSAFGLSGDPSLGSAMGSDASRRR